MDCLRSILCGHGGVLSRSGKESEDESCRFEAETISQSGPSGAVWGVRVGGGGELSCRARVGRTGERGGGESGRCFRRGHSACYAQLRTRGAISAGSSQQAGV